ncbi:MAG: DUF4418 family protein [Oscillospiraceae bacterium]|nr:DUF4418 family protein [Oscillospiraceae bacterium]
MNQTKGRTLDIFLLLLGLATAIIPLTIYHLVETGGMGAMGGMAMDMECKSACEAETIVGAAITVIAAASLFIKKIKLKLASSLVLILGGVAAIITPRLVGLCTSDEMACRYITAPTVTVLGILIIVLAAAKLLSGVLILHRSALAE